jgi:hypothetical protein
MTDASRLDVRKLAERWNPYRETVWMKCDTPITIEEVKRAWINRHLISPNHPKEMYMNFWDVSPREDHIRRVAWLIENYRNTHPIQIDFGIPGTSAHFAMIDGNHRLAAAIFLNFPYVWCDWSGALSEAEKFMYYEAEPERA